MFAPQKVWGEFGKLRSGNSFRCAEVPQEGAAGEPTRTKS